MKSTIRHPSQRRPQGFSLVEVLVALLVLAIGLLGLAALQTQGVRFNHDAFVRTQATTLAYDIIDKMRVERDNAGAYTSDPPPSNFPPRLPEPAGGYTAQNPPYNCNPGSVGVQNDLGCWLNAIELELPMGRATIARQAAPNDNLFDISVMWLDREPREIGGVTKIPDTQASCEAITNRTWVGAPTSRCFVTQTWTVWP